MTKTQPVDFDFDACSALAKSAPEEFEQQRRNVVEHFITSRARSSDLRGLQCRIDLERARARTPLKACLRFSSLMWDTFFNLQNALNSPVSEPGKQEASIQKPSARVIPFRRQMQTELTAASGIEERMPPSSRPSGVEL